MGFYRFVFTLVLRSESKVDTHIYVDGCTADRSVVGRFVFTHGNICTDEEVEAARVEIQHDAGIGAKVG